MCTPLIKALGTSRLIGSACKRAQTSAYSFYVVPACCHYLYLISFHSPTAFRCQKACDHHFFTLHFTPPRPKLVLHTLSSTMPFVPADVSRFTQGYLDSLCLRCGQRQHSPRGWIACTKPCIHCDDTQHHPRLPCPVVGSQWYLDHRATVLDG